MTDTTSAEPGQRGRILVVDDSRLVRRVVAGFLRKGGYVVDEAEDGRIALSLLGTSNYDVVVTDLNMPGVDGFAVLEAVRNGSSGTEVIILTGAGANDAAIAVRALRLGAHDFLTKPPSGSSEVILTVERALEKKRLRDANAMLVRQLEALTRTDALTGAANRRALDETMSREHTRARRYDLSLSVIVADLDHFKRVNDEHGHAAGDEVLKAFVQRAGEVFRECDGLFRTGGEEFVIVLPHTDPEGALAAAQRLVDAVAARPLRPGLGTITVSAGVASAQGKALAGFDLVAAADAVLYQAKGAGRNRAVAAPAPSPRAAAA
jgi:two-component system cell cycle response regulator